MQTTRSSGKTLVKNTRSATTVADMACEGSCSVAMCDLRVLSQYRSFVIMLRDAEQSGFGGLSPSNKTPIPPNWNVEHCKSGEFGSIFRMSNPPHKRKPLPQNRKAPYWKLSGDGSGADATCPTNALL